MQKSTVGSNVAALRAKFQGQQSNNIAPTPAKPKEKINIGVESGAFQASRNLLQQTLGAKSLLALSQQQ